MYYDRQGNRIDMWRWSELFHDQSYKRVASTTLEDGTWISTVWLGLSPWPDRREIFETMVFSASDNLTDQECWRYSTEAQAVAGHDQVVAKIEEALRRLREACDEIMSRPAPSD